MTETIDWVWGVDVATKKIAFGLLPLQPGAARVQANYVAIEETKLAQLRERLVQTLERTQLFAEAMSVHFPPMAVRVGQPVGRFPAPTLTAAWAITLTALRQALPPRLLIDSKTPKNWMDALGLRGAPGSD